MIIKVVLVCLICAVNARPREITLSTLLRNSSYVSGGQNITLEASSKEESSELLPDDGHENKNLFVKQKRQVDGGEGGEGEEDGEGGENGEDGEGEEGGEGEVEGAESKAEEEVSAKPNEITLSALLRNSSYTSDGQNITLKTSSNEESSGLLPDETHENQKLFVKQKRQDGGGGDGGGGEHSERDSFDVSQDDNATTESSDSFDHGSDDEHYHSDHDKRQADFVEAPHVEETAEESFYNSSKNQEYVEHENNQHKRQTFLPANETEATIENFEKSVNKSLTSNRRKRESDRVEILHSKETTKEALFNATDDETHYSESEHSERDSFDVSQDKITTTESSDSFDHDSDDEHYHSDRDRRQAGWVVEAPRVEETTDESLFNSSSNQEDIEHENNQHKRQNFLTDNETKATENLFIFENSENKSLISNRRKRESDRVEILPSEETTEEALFNASDDVTHYQESKDSERDSFDVSQDDSATTESSDSFDHDSDDEHYHTDRNRRQVDLVEPPHVEETTDESLHNYSGNEEDTRNENNQHKRQTFLTANKTEATIENLEKFENKSLISNRRKRQSDRVEILPSEETTGEALFNATDDVTHYPESEHSERDSFDVSQDSYATTESSDSFDHDSDDEHYHTDHNRRQAGFVESPHVEETTDESLHNSSSNQEDIGHENNQHKRQTFLPANKTDATIENFEKSENKSLISNRRKRQSDRVEILPSEETTGEALFNVTDDVTHYPESEHSEKDSFDVSQDSYATTESSDSFDHDSEDEHYHTDRNRRQAGFVESPHVEETTDESFYNTSSNQEDTGHEINQHRRQTFLPVNETESATENSEKSENKSLISNERKRQSDRVEILHSEETTEKVLFNVTNEETHYPESEHSERDSIDISQNEYATTESSDNFNLNSDNERYGADRKRRQADFVATPLIEETTEEYLFTSTNKQDKYFQHENIQQEKQVFSLNETETTTENLSDFEENTKNNDDHDRRKRQAEIVETDHSRRATEEPPYD